MPVKPECFGLRSQHGSPIPLRAVALRGEVIGGHARFTVEQRYENVERQAIEAIYAFPLPSDATVSGFVLEAAGRRIEGVVKARDEAFESYDRALLAGHGAALLDQERANVFTASVGNVMPGETVRVEIEYVQRLHADEGTLRIAIPTLVAPRYIPGAAAGERSAHGSAEPTLRVPDADRISPRIGAADYHFSFALRLRLGRELVVTSPSHVLACKSQDGAVLVSLAGDHAPLDRDLIVLCEHASDAAPGGIVAHKDGPLGTFALCHLPDLLGIPGGVQQGRLDVVFLLDRSGSMDGASIEEARKALRLCLRQLREGDRFSVIAFDDAQLVLSDQLLPFTQQTLEQADRWLAKLRAHGGTELSEPLMRALEIAQGTPTEPGAARDACVVLLTDGQVGNEEEILAAALERKRAARIYCFGIGTNVSDVLLLQLARSSAGACQFIHPGERIDEKVVATFARALAPAVRDVRVRYVDLDVEDQAPSELPDMVEGEPWMLLGRYRRAARGRIELRGRLRGDPFLLEIPASLPEHASAPALPKFWAAERVRELELMQLSGRRADAMKQRILELAIEHGIASRYTSFIALETRDADRLATTPAQARPVPVHAPAGWQLGSSRPADMVGGAVFAPGRAAPMRFASHAMHADAAIPTSAYVHPPHATVASAMSPTSRILGFSASPGAPGRSAPPPPPPPSDPAFALLCEQRASGLWDDGGDPVDAVAATAQALLELLELGVDSVHPQHGPLIRKAIGALLPLVERIAEEDAALAERAFAAAWLSASKRTRGTVAAAIERAGLSDLRQRLSDEAALRRAWLPEA
jgi:Ca-activated chloride channel homolog